MIFKKLHILLILSVWSLQGHSQTPLKEPVEIIVFDLDLDHVPDSVFLYPAREGTPGIFDRINIRLSSGTDTLLTAHDGWDKIDNLLTKNNSNSINSEFIFVYPEKDRTLILLFGYPFGAGREEFLVCEIRPKQIKKILDTPLDDIIFLKDLSGDGQVELLGRSFYELYDDDDPDVSIGSYSPFLIYRLDNPTVIDIELSKAYNEEHYIWAGTKYQENLKVAYPRDNGKPYLLKE